MEPSEFVEKLLGESSLEAIDLASDVERILAEQVLFLRGTLRDLRQEAVVGAHDVIHQLYERLEEKDRQIEDLREEIGFLRQQVMTSSG